MIKKIFDVEKATQFSKLQTKFENFKKEKKLEADNRKLHEDEEDEDDDDELISIEEVDEEVQLHALTQIALVADVNAGTVVEVDHPARGAGRPAKRGNRGPPRTKAWSPGSRRSRRLRYRDRPRPPANRAHRPGPR